MARSNFSLVSMELSDSKFEYSLRFFPRIGVAGRWLSSYRLGSVSVSSFPGELPPIPSCSWSKVILALILGQILSFLGNIRSCLLLSYGYSTSIQYLGAPSRRLIIQVLSFEICSAFKAGKNCPNL
jgi:hypothetical protein